MIQTGDELGDQADILALLTPGNHVLINVVAEKVVTRTLFEAQEDGTLVQVVHEVRPLQDLEDQG